MRKELHAAMLANGSPTTWDHVINQIGMFTFTRLKPKQVEHLTSKHHIYLTKDGRISMAGLSGPTVKYLADAMKDAVTNVTELTRFLCPLLPVRIGQTSGHRNTAKGTSSRV
jgi:aspartate aminotransferase